jgi:hypothetical protein
MPDEESRSARADAEAALVSLGERDAAVADTAGSRSQQALVSQGQRRVNLLWEVTQALIAVTTVSAVLWLALRNMRIPEVLQNMVFLIIGAYFSRTNHEKKGGVGPEYKGR